MPTNPENQNPPAQYEDKLLKLLEEAGAYDPNLKIYEQFLNCDKLWCGRTFRASVDLLEDFIRACGLLDRVTRIVAAQTLRFPFGVLPLAANLSLRLEKPLIIWKEYGDYLTGAPIVFGSRVTQDECLLLLHDVIEEGYSLIKMIDPVWQLSQCKVPAGVVLVDRSSKGGRKALEEKIQKITGERFEIFALVTDDKWDRGRHVDNEDPPSTAINT